MISILALEGKVMETLTETFVLSRTLGLVSRVLSTSGSQPLAY